MLGLGLVVLALVACGGSSAPPTSPTPPPVADPPKITCPPAVTIQSPDDNLAVVQYPIATVANGAVPVVTTCTPPSGTSFPLGQTPVTCTATDSLQRADTCSFSVTVLPVPRLTATSFLAFGDSITWGENGLDAPAVSSLTGFLAPQVRQRVQVPISETYPEVLHQDLVHRYTKQTPGVDNAGLPGEALLDSTTFPRFVSLTSSGRYDVVLIMEGANDLSDRDDRLEPAMIDVLREMVLDARSRGIRPYLATIPPEIQAGYRGGGASLVPGFNDQVRALAAGENVTLVDVYAALAGDVGTYIGIDGLHPTVQGYAKIAETFFTAVKQTLEATPAPTVPAAAATAPVRRSIRK
jgi:lysophospholipase L1-like esterase